MLRCPSASRQRVLFDVTVGPLIELWGFGVSGPVESIPDRAAIDQARALVGYGYLQVRKSPAAIRKTGPVQVDLSAIAKGHGVDRLARSLDGAGCTDYLVDIGGEVRAPRRQPGRCGLAGRDRGPRPTAVRRRATGAGAD